jgi:hypothetical protein
MFGKADYGISPGQVKYRQLKQVACRRLGRYPALSGFGINGHSVRVN